MDIPTIHRIGLPTCSNKHNRYRRLWALNDVNPFPKNHAKLVHTHENAWKARPQEAVCIFKARATTAAEVDWPTKAVACQATTSRGYSCIPSVDFVATALPNQHFARERAAHDDLRATRPAVLLPKVFWNENPSGARQG